MPYKGLIINKIKFEFLKDFFPGRHFLDTFFIDNARLSKALLDETYFPHDYISERRMGTILITVNLFSNHAHAA